jgi:hypothetical protein
MQPELVDALFIEETHRFTLTEVVRISGLAPADLDVLVVCGAIAPQDRTAAQWTFSAWSVDVARRARALRDEFAIDDVHAVAVLVRFEARVRSLEREIAALRARLG